MPQHEPDTSLVTSRYFETATNKLCDLTADYLVTRLKAIELELASCEANQALAEDLLRERMVVAGLLNRFAGRIGLLAIVADETVH
jgi:hypothetical protein